MMEETKTYSVIGTVSIGTDEYRDLIESLKNAEHEKDRVSRENTDRYWKINKLEKEVESLKEFKAYVIEKCHDSFKLWKLENERDDEDE